MKLEEVGFELGKPYEPNAIIKNDIEFILMQRKPGGYRQPTEEQRRLSMIPKDKFDKWFQQFWNLTGASTKEHPAPFPLESASRLVQMFSFAGDTVLDPFCGTATTMVAAMKFVAVVVIAAGTGVDFWATETQQKRKTAEKQAGKRFICSMNS